jgi:hypothetical protein
MSKHYDMRAYRGHVRKTLHIFNFSILMKISGELHALATMSMEKEPWYPLDRRMSRPQRTILVSHGNHALVA